MDIRKATLEIENRVDLLWTHLEVPVSKISQPFTIPGSPNAWVLLEVLWTTGFAISVGAPGGNRSRRVGYVNCYGFVPSFTGAGDADYYAGELASLYERQDFGGVVCGAAEPGGEARGVDGDWFGRLVAVPFFYDEYT